MGCTLKSPLTQFPEDIRTALKEIESHFFGCAWNEVFDFIELANKQRSGGLTTALNAVLESNLAAYQIIEGKVTPIRDKHEIEAIEDALDETTPEPGRRHISNALDLLNNRETPNFAKSMAESMSAVEAMCKLIAKKSKATLDDAIRVLRNENHGLHPALADGFAKLYGYTGDAEGIRHAGMDPSTLTVDDAVYFLVTCSAFVNYLKAKFPDATTQ